MSEVDPTDIAEQDRARKANEDRKQTLVDYEASDWRWLMGEKRGRRIAWRFLEKCGLYRSSFTGNSATFFNEGERNVGLKILGILMAECMEDYTKMLLESRDYK